MNLTRRRSVASALMMLALAHYARYILRRH